MKRCFCGEPSDTPDSNGSVRAFTAFFGRVENRKLAIIMEAGITNAKNP